MADPFKASRSGFTLIEVIFALVILMLAIQVIGRSLLTIVRADAQASSLLRSALMVDAAASSPQDPTWSEAYPEAVVTEDSVASDPDENPHAPPQWRLLNITPAAPRAGRVAPLRMAFPQPSTPP